MAEWRKSSYSDGTRQGGCIEVTDLGPTIAVRDSQDPEGPRLHVGDRAWRDLLSHFKTRQHQE
ncbi:DUF397 domain-containing protein [Spirillospora sp. NPDC047279]|uniref:DUF397 domain-containing protein n=1 Tax=Spirillospora sp. NPDC047279 TaxID=3155478 RepID=UPI0034047B9B